PPAISVVDTAEASAKPVRRRTRRVQPDAPEADLPPAA
ncbi:MAG: hypothetical protein JWP15_1123, partial [Alphaproteobacteria bacterium]|nr:hypothetical protein [Alphaproteobacteria bacterium]